MSPETESAHRGVGWAAGWLVLLNALAMVTAAINVYAARSWIDQDGYVAPDAIVRPWFVPMAVVLVVVWVLLVATRRLQATHRVLLATAGVTLGVASWVWLGAHSDGRAGLVIAVVGAVVSLGAACLGVEPVAEPDAGPVWVAMLLGAALSLLGAGIVILTYKEGVGMDPVVHYEEDEGGFIFVVGLLSVGTAVLATGVALLARRWLCAMLTPLAVLGVLGLLRVVGS